MSTAATVPGAAVAWAATAAALLIAPGPRATTRIAARRSARTAPGRTAPARTAPGRSTAGLVVAVLALAGACVALLGSRAGIVAAAVACPVAAVVLRAAQRRPVAARVDRRVALTLDLAAAALHSGRPLADALTVAAPAADETAAAILRRVAGLLRLGADPAEAWSCARDGPLAPVAATAVRSAASGIKLAAAFERLAADIRADISAAAAVRAHRAGVLSMAPLGACFLPSFVCLGIAPVVVGIAKSATGVLP